MNHQVSNKKIWHIIVGGAIGNLVEWYNFLLYGYLASVISQLFFPVQNKLLSLILVFTLFAISFFVRPFGGVLFGWIGDTYGRQRALVISIIMMGIPTLLISCLPTYQSIGIISPILLCIFRILQGFSAGGEHTGSAIYIAEQAPSNRRSLWVSTVVASASLGVLISSIAALLLVHLFNDAQLLAWGWRVGYWFGVILSVTTFFLRINLPETPAFEKYKQEQTSKSSILTNIKNAYKVKEILIVFSLASSWGILYQILFVWMPTYLMYTRNFSRNAALEINSMNMLLLVCSILYVGYLGDFINRKLLARISCIAMFVLAYPLFIMLSTGSLVQAYIAIGIFTIIFSLYLPSVFLLMLELFPVSIRYSGFSTGFNIGLAIFGGTCPLVATWLIQITQNNIVPAFYMMLAALAALLTLKNSQLSLQHRIFA